MLQNEPVYTLLNEARIKTRVWQQQQTSDITSWIKFVRE